MTDDGDGSTAPVAESGGKRRLWLVDRSFRGENLVTLVYADVEGSVHVQKQLSHAMLTSQPVTAALDVPAEDVEPVPAGESDRYGTQATRMAKEHDPDDEV